MRGSSKKGILFPVWGFQWGSLGGGRVFLQQQQKTPSSSSMRWGFGFSGAGCGRGFLGVPWGCYDRQKMEAFPAGVGVLARSWKDGVSSLEVGSDGQKGEVFLARGCCRRGTTTMGGKN